MYPKKLVSRPDALRTQVRGRAALIADNSEGYPNNGSFVRLQRVPG
jgi:hypothetical protein